MILHLADHWADEAGEVAAEAVGHSRPQRAGFGFALRTAIAAALSNRPDKAKPAGDAFQPYGVPGGWMISQTGWDPATAAVVLRFYRMRRTRGRLGPDIYHDHDQCAKDCERLNCAPWAEAQV